MLVETEPAKLVEYKQFGEATVAAHGVVTNASDRRFSYVEVSADFLDGSDAIVGEGLSNLTPLAPGRGWKDDVDYVSEADVPPSAVTSTDVSIVYSDVAVSQPANDLVAAESEPVDIERFDERTKAVRGTIRNEGETTSAFVEVEAQFIDDADVVVVAFWSTIEDLEPARGWRFPVDYHSEADAPRLRGGRLRSVRPDVNAHVLATVERSTSPRWRRARATTVRRSPISRTGRRRSSGR